MQGENNEESIVVNLADYPIFEGASQTFLFQLLCSFPLLVKTGLSDLALAHKPRTESDSLRKERMPKPLISPLIYTP